MHIALIRVIDQTRMLDQDLIRLQQKVDVVLEYRENEKKKEGKEMTIIKLPFILFILTPTRCRMQMKSR